jgi:hypothetical protein
MYREQFIGGVYVSTAVKLNITVDELKSAPGAGWLRFTDGGLVSTVKFLAALVPVLFAESLQVTFQVCFP